MMAQLLRQAMAHLPIPASVATIWFYAHCRNLAVGEAAVATWREGDIVRTGNPYAAPPPPRLTWREPEPPDDVPGDAEAAAPADPLLP